MSQDLFYLDGYDGSDIVIMRFSLTGSPGSFTKAKASMARDGWIVKIGLWGSSLAETYHPTLGSSLCSMVNASLTGLCLKQTELDLINRLWPGSLSTKTQPMATSPVSKSGGCWCGAWISGGIHLDYCAPHLIGKPCQPSR